MSSQFTPFPLRIPDELRQHLKERAVANRRSTNAEIIVLIESALKLQQQGAQQ